MQEREAHISRIESIRENYKRIEEFIEKQQDKQSEFEPKIRHDQAQLLELEGQSEALEVERSSQSEELA